MRQGIGEKELQLYWLCTVERGSRLPLCGGGEAEVVSPGILNRDAGPDFSNARVHIGGKLWVGDVEMHLRAGDWYRHGHQGDKAYGSVVLHVVMEDDDRVTDGHGHELPQTVMSVPENFGESVYMLSVPGEPYLRCASIADFWKSLSPLQIRDWMETLFTERFRLKGDAVMALNRRLHGDWRQTAFAVLARALGFGVNAEAMERLALSVSLNTLGRHSQSLFQLEALLFGQAGMLEGVMGDGYRQRLAREYDFLAHKYGLQPLYGNAWKLARTRPANFPFRRIAQLAAFCKDGFTLASDMIENSGNVSALMNLFRRDPGEFWSTHYSFNGDKECAPQKVSEWNCRMLCINAAVPFLFAYGRGQGREELVNDAENILRRLPAETESRMRIWKRAGAPVECAADTQSLHHLFSAYCSHNRCLECRLGGRLLRYWAQRSD